MKKYLKILLLLFIVLFVSIVNVYAANSTADLTLTADKTEAKVGEVIIFNLSANCETGIEGIDSTLEWDKTKLELQNINVDAKFSNISGEDVDTGEYKLTVISNSTQTVTQSNFATIEFKLLNTAEVDEDLTVKLSNIEIGDSNDKWMQVDNKTVTLKVVEDTPGEENNPGTGDNNPGEDNNPGIGDNNPGEENNPGTGDNNPGEENNPGTGDNNPGEDNNPGTDNTQADKEINHAGLEDYAFVIIAIMVIMVFVSYKKYQAYKNI